MPLELDAVIQSPDYYVDMKTGLNTLQGASDAVRTISETLVTGEVPEKKTYKGSVRTQLKQSFKGSFGQMFSVEFYAEELERKYKSIGADIFSELISYYLNDSVFKEVGAVSDEAEQIIKSLGDVSAELSSQLRKSSMRNLHDICVKFNYGVKIRTRRNRSDPSTLAEFDQHSARTLQAKLSNKAIDIVAGITRLNINTGNGRLQLIGQKETVAFGFTGDYRNIELSAKKIFSDNLDKNNGIEQDKWQQLRIAAKPIILHEGRIVKYIVTGIYDA